MTLTIYEGFSEMKAFISIHSQHTQGSAFNITTTTAVTSNEMTNEGSLSKTIGSTIFKTLDMLVVWSVWLVVKDLERRDKRIAMAKVESTVTTDIIGQQDAGSFNEKGQRSSTVLDMIVTESTPTSFTPPSVQYCHTS